MFLGELLRLVIISLLDNTQQDFFSGFREKEIANLRPRKRWSVDSVILSVAEEDTTPNSVLLEACFQSLFNGSAPDFSISDLQAVKTIAHAIGTRAARLAGMATGSVIVKTGSLNHASNLDQLQPSTEADQMILVDIAFDGSVIQYYPGFEAIMRETFYVIPAIGVE